MRKGKKRMLQDVSELVCELYSLKDAIKELEEHGVDIAECPHVWGRIVNALEEVIEGIEDMDAQWGNGTI